MIPTTASTLSAGLSQVTGKAHGASAKKAEAGSFSAILQDSAADADNADASATPIPDMATAAEGETVSLVALSAGGNPGKANGKILPDTVKAATDADARAHEDDTAHSETGTDAAAVQAALSMMVPLALAPATFQPSARSETPTAASPSLPGTGPVARGLRDNTRAADAAFVATTAATVRAEARGKLLDQTPATAQASPAQTQAQTSSIKLAPIEIVAETTPATSAQLATRSAAAPFAQGTELAQAQAPTQPAQMQATATATSSASSVQAASTPLPGSNTASGGGSNGKSATGRDAASASRRSSTVEPASTKIAGTPTAEPVLAPAAPVSHIVEAAQPRPVTASAPSLSIAQPSHAEAPQDFATLVARLAEAREAASPQLVRTAIAHSEFGQISLQFRHEDNALSVTMTNSDPGFVGAVQAAANASLAGGNNGGGDDSARPQHQQQQQYTSASSQQSAGNGAGAGNGSGQNQQGRAEQAAHTMNRGQGTGSRSQDRGATASRTADNDARRGGGIYA